jgi:ABC-type molybdate transport system ATPase subunit
MDEHLASLTEEERQEVRAFLARFDQQADMKVEQLLHETQDTERLSAEALEMRKELLDGKIPLLDQDGELYFKPRDALTLEDTARSESIKAPKRRRYEREIGDLGESSEN